MGARNIPDAVQKGLWLEPTPEEQVFGNDMLLDKILKLAIYDNNKLHPKTFNSCKLVKPLWLERVTKFAYKNDTRSPVKLNPVVNPTKVSNFLQTFKNLPAKRIPPFSLQLGKSGKHPKKLCFQFTMSMYKDCIECLTRCGVRLVKLEMDCFPSMWKLIWNPWQPRPLYLDYEIPSLPNLKELSIREYFGYDEDNGPTDVTKVFIRNILDGATCLQSFSLHHAPDGNETEYFEDDVQIKNIRLPYSVTHVSLSCSEVECLHVWADLLLITALPKLTSLIFNGPTCRYKEHYYRILDHFRHQLKALTIIDPVPHTLPLPKMEVLEEFFYKQSRWTCEGGLSNFPGLKRFLFQSSESELLNRWLESGPCNFVRQGAVILDYPLGRDIPLPDEEEQVRLMRGVKRAFPAVLHLMLRMPPVKEMHWIQYVFKEMTHLEDLRIEICPFDIKYGMTNKVNVALLGVPVEELASLEEQKGNWGNIKDWSYWKSEDWVSITKMKELKYLTINALQPTSVTYVVNLDVLMQFALLRMPKLEQLTLYGNENSSFEVSNDMAKTWMDLGRRLY